MRPSKRPRVAPPQIADLLSSRVDRFLMVTRGGAGAPRRVTVILNGFQELTERVPSAVTMPLSPGTTLGPHQIDAPLGAGGMGEVYKATDTRLDRTVAIKVLPPTLTRNETAKQPRAVDLYTES